MSKLMRKNTTEILERKQRYLQLSPIKHRCTNSLSNNTPDEYVERIIWLALLLKQPKRHKIR